MNILTHYDSVVGNNVNRHFYSATLNPLISDSLYTFSLYTLLLLSQQEHYKMMMQ